MYLSGYWLFVFCFECSDFVLQLFDSNEAFRFLCGSLTNNSLRLWLCWNCGEEAISVTGRFNSHRVKPHSLAKFSPCAVGVLLWGAWRPALEHNHGRRLAGVENLLKVRFGHFIAGARIHISFG